MKALVVLLTLFVPTALFAADGDQDSTTTLKNVYRLVDEAVTDATHDSGRYFRNTGDVLFSVQSSAGGGGVDCTYTSVKIEHRSLPTSDWSILTTLEPTGVNAYLWHRERGGYIRATLSGITATCEAGDALTVLMQFNEGGGL
jgi:hypothetical protein